MSALRIYICMNVFYYVVLLLMICNDKVYAQSSCEEIKVCYRGGQMDIPCTISSKRCPPCVVDNACYEYLGGTCPFQGDDCGSIFRLGGASNSAETPRPSPRPSSTIESPTTTSIPLPTTTSESSTLAPIPETTTTPPTTKRRIIEPSVSPTPTSTTKLQTPSTTEPKVTEKKSTPTPTKNVTVPPKLESGITSEPPSLVVVPPSSNSSQPENQGKNDSDEKNKSSNSSSYGNTNELVVIVFGITLLSFSIGMVFITLLRSKADLNELHTDDEIEDRVSGQHYFGGKGLSDTQSIVSAYYARGSLGNCSIPQNETNAPSSIDQSQPVLPAVPIQRMTSPNMQTVRSSNNFNVMGSGASYYYESPTQPSAVYSSAPLPRQSIGFQNNGMRYSHSAGSLSSLGSGRYSSTQSLRVSLLSAGSPSTITPRQTDFLTIGGGGALAQPPPPLLPVDTRECEL